MSKLEAASASVPKPKTNFRWFIVFWLTVGSVVNYIDRVNFGVAAPVMMKEFGMGMGHMGILMSGFFWSYTIAQLPTGYLLNKLGPKKVLGVAAFGWGVVTMAIGFCMNFTQFLVARIAMGLTEAPAFPANARVVSVWVPRSERTFASAIFDSAARAGSAFAPPIVAMIIATFGWKASFVITGALAVVWSFLWFAWYHEPADHPKLKAEELAYIRQDEVISEDGSVAKTDSIPMRHLLRYGQVIKICLGYFFYIYVFTVFAYWLPTYFMKVRGLSLKEMGFAASIPWICAVVFELIGGKVFDKWFEHGGNINTVRRTGLGISFFGSAIFLMLCTTAETAFLAILFLSLSLGTISIGICNIWAGIADIAPYGQAGGLSGIMAFFGNIGGIIAPIVTGYLAESHFGFNGAFAVAAAFGVVAGLCFVFNHYDHRLVPRT